MPRKSYPEYHKTLLEKSAYPSAPRRIKFEETHRSYLYRTGSHLYKIRKPGPLYSSLAVKERFTQEACRLGRHWGGDLMEEAVPIVRTPAGFALGGEGEPVEYALKMTQLSDNYWLDKLQAQGKITPTAIGRLARFLAERHAESKVEEKTTNAGRPENYMALVDEVVYQSRKYVPHTLTEPMLEMIARPLARFVEDFRKLFLRRNKRGRIVECHGAFIPEHIYIRGMDIRAISPLEGQPKYRILDSTNDVATLTNELRRMGADDLAELFVKRYTSASHDRDLVKLLPAYQVLRAMHAGLLQSEWLAELPEDHPEREERISLAGAYFNLAVRASREIPRSEA